MSDVLIFEPSDEDIEEFGREVLAAAWANCCYYVEQERSCDDVRL